MCICLHVLSKWPQILTDQPETLQEGLSLLEDSHRHKNMSLLHLNEGSSSKPCMRHGQSLKKKVIRVFADIHLCLNYCNIGTKSADG